MSNYRFLNANPDDNDSEDCTVRAISVFLNKPWNDIYWDLAIEGFLMKRMPVEDRVWSRYLEKQGCKFSRIPNECPMCYTVNDFTERHKYGRYLLKVADHVVCSANGYYYDTWDSGNEIVLFYWYR
jgi:hypothetical protein